MNKRSLGLVAGIAAVAGLSAGVGIGVVSAAEERRDDAGEMTAFTQAKLTLTDAVVVAERETGGRAYEAGFDTEAGKATYEIETVAADGGRRELRIDAVTGAVLANQRDWDDLADRD